MKKIEKLTREQEELLPRFREEWLRIGLSTDPIDFETAKKTIADFYKKIRKEEPLFLKFSSPMMCELALERLRSQLDSQLDSQLYSQLDSQLYSQLDLQLYSQLDLQLRSQLYSQLDSQLYSQLDLQLRSQLRSQLYSQLYSQLDSQLYSQLDSQLDSQLYSQLRSQLYSQLDSQLYLQLRSQLGSQSFTYNSFSGQISVYWLAFYRFCNEIGVNYEDKDLNLLNQWVDIARSCFRWAPFEGICIISERPTNIHFDDQRRLHNEIDMAVKFSDGWGVYAWRGIRANELIIKNPEQITTKLIEEEQNSELRRVMLERYGFAKYFAEAGGELVDKRTVWGQPVELYRKIIDGVEMGYLYVINGTEETDGSRHKFIIPCKIIDNDAERSVYGTYPELIDDIRKYYPGSEMEMLRQSIRT
jgi:hypothetical protein